MLHPGAMHACMLWCGAQGGEAVWLGEALAARFRVVGLEVPPGVASVALLVQGVTAEGGLQPLQLAATLAVPQA
jgi:hypothetical protein